MKPEAAHSPLGPSSSERWLQCPGSVLATRDLPDTESEYALEGTAAHSLAEKCRELDEPAKKYLGYTIDVRRIDGTFYYKIVDQEMVDGVQMFIDHVNALPGLDFNEMRVRYDEYVKDGFGTLDAARGDDGTVYIRDLKYGKGIQVFAKNNTQLKLYALGFYLQYGHLFDVKEFDLGIVQPRLDHIDTWRVSLEDLLLWAECEVRPAAKLAMEPGAPFQAGEWCQFCKLKATCTTRAASIFNEVVGEFDDVDDAVAKVDKVKSPVGMLTNEEIGKILPKLKIVKAWCKDIEAFAKREAIAQRMPGFKLVEGKSNRAFVPGAATRLEAAARAAEVDVEALYEPRDLKSPAQVEKLLGKKRFGKDGDLADTVVKPKGKPTLAPEDDPRPAMIVDATDDFEDVEE